MPSTQTTPVIVRLENELIERMDTLVGERNFTSRSALAREALRIGLDAMESGLEGVYPMSSQTPVEPALAADMNLKTWAHWVMESGRRCTSGRFGDDRVLINHVWRKYKADQKPKGMNLDGFKQKLLEANRARFLSLVCADMAPLLDQKDVRESEVTYLSARFHFLCI